MSKELVVSATPHETKVAILEDDELVELYFEREKQYGLAGSIYKGRVTRVLPGMQSAFVNVGLDRDAFLYVSDFFEDNEEYDRIVTTAEDKVLKMEEKGQVSPAALVGGAGNGSAPPVAPTIMETGPGPAVPGVRPEPGPPASRQEPVETDRRRSQWGTQRVPQKGPQGEQGEGGRRGRRGRRRGRAMGGRGFPESKYASRMGPPPQRTQPLVGLPVEEDEDFAVLPGESLAKYTQPGAVDEAGGGEAAGEVADARVEGGEVAGGEAAGREVAGGAVEGREVASGGGASVEAASAEGGGGQTAQAEGRVARNESAADESGPGEIVRGEVARGEAGGESFPGGSFGGGRVRDEAGPGQAIGREAAGGRAVHGRALGSEAVPGEVARAVVARLELPSRVVRGAELEEPSQKKAAGAAGAVVEADQPAPRRDSAGPDAPVASAAAVGAALATATEGDVEPAAPALGAEERETLAAAETAPEEMAQPELVQTHAAEEAPAGEDGTSMEEAAESAEAATSEQAAEGLAETEEPAAAEAGGAEADSASGEAEGAAGREASVRERPYGKRYLHRGSRRMRRRGERSDSRDRAAQTPAAEASPAAEEASPRPAEASISDLLKEGREIIVQIAKEPLGKKGARITSHIALPGRYLVYMPTVDHVGVSRKIVSDEERLRLKRIVQAQRVGMPGGFIVRTAGEGQPEEEIRSDMHFLYNLWLDMRQKAERKPAPALIHHDLNLVERLLRDQLTETFKTIWVDSQEDYERILQFVERFQPALVGRVKLYTRSNPIFDEFGITPELEKALRPKVWLKSGGYIVINQTEALVAIDVNTGKYVGKSNRLEDTIVKTNVDAVKEIVRQIRLRDLGGIIVVDFIDMDERKNRQKVMQALDEALRGDRAPSKILQFNDFGLVAITRKRVKQSLERTLCSPCPYCDASGYVKSVTTMIQEILVEAKKIARSLDGRDVTLRVNPEVGRALKSRDNTYLEELETILGRPVLVKSDPQLHQERFDFN